MPLRRTMLVTLVALAGALAAPAPSAAEPTVIYDCSPLPRDCLAWYRTNVSIDWTVAGNTEPPVGCVDKTLTMDTKGSHEVCSAYDGVRVTKDVVIKIDKTPPMVIGAIPTRPPDGNGWYRAPVGVAFRGNDATSGVRACTTTSYAGPDSRSARVPGACVDIAGNRAASTFALRYDATGPDVTHGKAGRKPDYRRWYNHPVTWHFRGRDGLSGMGECPPVVYRGPDGAHARVVGACRDKAGNVSTRGFMLRYDGTAPRPPTVRAIPHDRSVRLKIRAAREVRRIVIVRSPGVGGTRDSTLYRGRPRSVTDRHVRNGKRYRYTVVARDRAANRSRRTVHAVPHTQLLQPPNGAALAVAPLLRWTPVRGADYYNVQLRRNGRKVLSRWPRRPRLQLRSSWRFEGRVRHLVPGTYRWDVWPGFGRQSAARYGERIGSRRFVITAAVPAQ